MKDNNSTQRYLVNDLVRFAVLSSVLIGILMAVYFYNQSSLYFDGLAQDVYSKLVN